MKTKCLVIIAALVATVIGHCAASQSAPADAKDGWSVSVPNAERQSFLSSFTRAVSLRKQSAWSDLYNLRENYDGVTKEQFISNMSQLHQLVQFQPRSTFYVPSLNAWAIKGCARYRTASKKEYSAPSIMHAYLTDHRWLFDDLAIETDKSYRNDMRYCKD
jgi:hypothetical protein